MKLVSWHLLQETSRQLIWSMHIHTVQWEEYAIVMKAILMFLFFFSYPSSSILAKLWNNHSSALILLCWWETVQFVKRCVDSKVIDRGCLLRSAYCMYKCFCMTTGMHVWIIPLLFMYSLCFNTFKCFLKKETSQNISKYWNKQTFYSVLLSPDHLLCASSLQEHNSLWQEKKIQTPSKCQTLISNT